MSNEADRLRALLETTPPFFVAMVDSVQDNGDVNLRYGSAVIPGVPAGSGYPLRKAGDKVIVLTLQSGAWLVVSTAGSPLPPEEEEPEPVEIPPEVTATWGTSPPTGSTWRRPDEMWFRVNADRSIDLYGEYQPSSPPPPPPPPPKPPKAPSPVTTTPTATGAWRDGKRESNQPPRQSKYASSFGPYSGAWFYGNLRTHAAGKTVSSMTISLGRSRASNGISGGARVRLYLTSAASPKSSPPSRYSSVWSPGTLARGERKTWTLPAVWAQHLASGQARGIVAYSSVQRESIIYSASAPIRVRFSA